MKIIGLLLTLLVLGLLFYVAYGRKDGSAAADPAAASATLGAPPPADVASNPEAAKRHSVRQMCLADCAAEENRCRTVAQEVAEREACSTAKVNCDSHCP